MSYHHFDFKKVGFGLASPATPATIQSARPGNVAIVAAPFRKMMNSDDFGGRAALIEYGAGVPREWAEGFARLDMAMPPKGFDERRWRTLIDDGGKFLDRWGADAARLGWTAADVFGVSPRAATAAPSDAASLVMLINGGEVVAISPFSADIKATCGGAALVYLRKPRGGSVALWELAEPKPRTTS
jgi:hypothetical protein